jgi:hypothetical protein
LKRWNQIAEENFVENEWCNIGPKYRSDKFGLPNCIPGMQQPKESQLSRKEYFAWWWFIFRIWDPCTYVYSYPNQMQNYPAITKALPHILQNIYSLALSSSSSDTFNFSTPTSFSPKSSPSTHCQRTITLSGSTAPPSPQPSTSKVKASKFS